MMSRQLRDVLERVARRVREVRLWNSLALCWAAWALVGALLALAGVRSVVILSGFAMLALSSGLACVISRQAIGARPPRGRPPHRGVASRTGRCPPDRGRGRPVWSLGTAWVPARDRCRQGSRTPPLARLARRRPPESPSSGQVRPSGDALWAGRGLDRAREPGRLRARAPTRLSRPRSRTEFPMSR